MAYRFYVPILQRSQLISATHQQFFLSSLGNYINGEQRKEAGKADNPCPFRPGRSNPLINSDTKMLLYLDLISPDATNDELR